MAIERERVCERENGREKGKESEGKAKREYRVIAHGGEETREGGLHPLHQLPRLQPLLLRTCSSQFKNNYFAEM